MKLPLRFLGFVLFLCALWATAFSFYSMTHWKMQRLTHTQKTLVEPFTFLIEQVQTNSTSLLPALSHFHSAQFQWIQKDPDTIDASSKAIVAFDSRFPERKNATLTEMSEFHRLALEVNEPGPVWISTLYSSGWVSNPKPGQWLISAVSEFDLNTGSIEIIEKLFWIVLLLASSSLVLFGLASPFFFSKLRTVFSPAQEIAKGSLQAHLPSFGSTPPRSEAEVFSVALQKLQSHVAELSSEGLEKVKIEQEVNIAAAFQQAILPPISISTAQFQCESYYLSSKKTGGDYWGFLETGQEIYLYAADATGHGLTSSMLTAAARGCLATIQNLTQLHSNLKFSPSDILSLANQAVLSSAQEELNMTMFVAQINLLTGEMHYANAAHSPGWLVRPKGNVYETLTLRSKGMRLGESIEFTPPAVESLQLSSDDMLFLHTDGIFDCTNAAGEELGKKKIKQIIESTPLSSNGPLDLKAALIKGIESHTQKREQEDDLFFAIFRPKNIRSAGEQK